MDSSGPRAPRYDDTERRPRRDRDGRYSFGTWSRPRGTRRLSGAVAFLIGFGLALAGFALGIGLILALGLFLPQALFEDPLAQIAFSLIPLQGIAFPVVAVLYVKARNLPLSYFRARIPSLYDGLIAFGGFVLAIFLVFAVGIAISVLGAETAQRSDQQLLMNVQVLQFLIPASLLLIGPGEELLFRGTIQTTLREAFSAPVAILLASSLFAPAHIVALQGGLQGLAVSIGVLFIPSIVFGAVYEYTENLVVPALSHGLYNAFLFSLLYVAVTMGDSAALLL